MAALAEQCDTLTPTHTARRLPSACTPLADVGIALGVFQIALSQDTDLLAACADEASLAAYTASYTAASSAPIVVTTDVEEGKGGYGSTETPVAVATAVATAVPVDA